MFIPVLGAANTVTFEVKSLAILPPQIANGAFLQKDEDNKKKKKKAQLHDISDERPPCRQNSAGARGIFPEVASITPQYTSMSMKARCFKWSTVQLASLSPCVTLTHSQDGRAAMLNRGLTDENRDFRYLRCITPSLTSSNHEMFCLSRHP